MSTRRGEVSVAVDMVRCTGHGICAWVFPERVALDEWGFAHVDPAPVGGLRGQRRARRAERACPRRALLVTAVAPEPARPSPARPTV